MSQANLVKAELSEPVVKRQKYAGSASLRGSHVQLRRQPLLSRRRRKETYMRFCERQSWRHALASAVCGGHGNVVVVTLVVVVFTVQTPGAPNWSGGVLHSRPWPQVLEYGAGIPLVHSSPSDITRY